MRYYLILLSIIFVGCQNLSEREYSPSTEPPLDVYSEPEDDDFDDGFDEYLEDIQSPSEYGQADTIVIGEDTLKEDEAVTEVIDNATGTAFPRAHFAVLDMDCNVRDAPRGRKLYSLSKGRRLWVEVSQDPDWYTVYRKRSLAYMHRSCFIEEL